MAMNEPMEKQRSVRIATTLVAIVVVAYFLPAIVFLLDRVGLKLIDSKEVLGHHIAVGDGWFPVYSSATALGKLVLSPTDAPTVVYCKVDWVTPWGCQQVSMYRHKFDVEIFKSRGLFSEIKSYSWGEAGIVKDEVTQTPGRKLAIFLGKGLAVSAVDLVILGEIKGID